MRFWYVLWLACCFSGLTAQSSAENLLQAALQTDSEGDHATAAQLYDSLYWQGYRSADLLLNQGNAYYEDGQLGRAILAYERGLRWRPGHRALRHNLSIAQQDVQLQLTRFPEFFLWRWADWLGGRLGVRGARWLAILCWWLGLGLLAYWHFGRKRIGERARFWLPPVAAGFLVLFTALWWLAHFRNNRLARSDEGIFVLPQVEVLASPASHASYEMTAYEGLRARVVDAHAGYRKVEFDNGSRGWVPANAIEMI